LRFAGHKSPINRGDMMLLCNGQDGVEGAP
jgi:hypothetical protein